MSKLRETRTWKGTSPEGLEYEIDFWGEGDMCDGHGMWNYYVHLNEGQFAPDIWNRIWLEPSTFHDRADGRKDPAYDYLDCPLSKARWHGGITFYEKKARVDTDHAGIKAGCDYGHAWDRDAGYGYDPRSVQHDALQTCRDLARILKPLARCTYSGAYFNPACDMSKATPGWKAGPLSPAGLGMISMWSRKNRERREKAA